MHVFTVSNGCEARHDVNPASIDAPTRATCHAIDGWDSHSGVWPPWFRWDEATVDLVCVDWFICVGIQVRFRLTRRPITSSFTSAMALIFGRSNGGSDK